MPWIPRHPAAGAEAPPSRDLTGAEGRRGSLYEAPKSDPDTILHRAERPRQGLARPLQLKISTGERTLIRKNTERITGWRFDLKGQLRLATRSADNGDTEILRVDADDFTLIYS